MQHQSKQQVASHLGVNVSTTKCLVTREREAGHVADQLRSRFPCVTLQQGFSFLILMSVTATETTLTTVDIHYYPIHPGKWGWYLGTLDLGTLLALYGMLKAHAQRIFSMRQWGWILLLRSSISLFFCSDGRHYINQCHGEKASPPLVLLKGTDYGAVLLLSGVAFLMV